MPHELYQLEDGRILPSVTEVLGVLGSPILMRWSNGLGFRHINYTSYMDRAAIRGTICHEIISHCIDKEYTINSYDISADDFKVICGYENTIKSFYKESKFSPQFIEKAFLSPELGYAGCPDYYGDITLKESPKGYEGVTHFGNALIDWKTSKKPNEKHFLQLGGYSTLLKIFGIIPKYYMVVDFHEDTRPTIKVKNEHEILKYEKAFSHLFEFWKFYSTVDPSILKTKR